MIFNKHSALEGRHALLSASKYHWLSKEGPQFDAWYDNLRAAAIGSEIHDIAAKLIKHKIKLPRNRTTLSQYVNDAIGYRMEPELILFYSVNCFGTADALSFRDNLLRIHDLKTGVSPASIKQLMVYAAMFCHEYEQDPYQINFELRIYQNDEIKTFEPEKEDILFVMRRIVELDNRIEEMKAEAQV
jgi:hypothetical protein